MQLSNGNAEWILLKARSQTIVSRKKRLGEAAERVAARKTEPKQFLGREALCGESAIGLS